MGSEWRETTWGELATLEYGKSLRGYQSASGPYKVYGTNGPIGWHDEALYSLPGVVIGRKGAYRGVHYSSEPFFVIDTAFYLKPKAEIDIRWAYYQLLTQDINGLDSGSAIPSTNREDFYGLSVQVPPLPEQRAIAHILGTLDDKIELNRRLNQTLEAMARAIFQDWFVDFGPVRAKLAGQEPYLPPELWALFPDRLADTELGEAPEGWGVKALAEIAEQLRDNENPLTSPETIFSHFSIPAYDEGLMPRQEMGKSIKSTKSHVPPDSILLSKLNPEIERVWLVDVLSDERAVCSTEFLVLQARLPFQRSYIYCLACSAFFRQRLQALVTGTSKSHQRAPASAILELEVLFPTVPVIQAFEKQVSSLFNRALACRRESRTLAAVRDALLPRLVSGEVGVRKTN